MRIFHLVNLLHYGGIESYVKELAYEQCRLGHQVGILVCLKAEIHNTEELKKLESAGIWTTCIKASSGHDIKLALRIPIAIRQFDPDIIHLSSTPLFAAIALCFSRVPKLVTLHLMGSNNLKDSIGHFAYRSLTDGVIAVSDAVLDFHKNVCTRFSRSKWTRIYNGIHLERFLSDKAKAFPEGTEEIVLTMTCRMEADKHVDDAIRALAIIQAQTSKRSFRLKLIGTGSEIPSLKKLASDLRVAEAVDFLGYQVDVLPFLQTAHGHLVLSEKETFSISALEAMACNVPVISYCVEGGFHELHHHGLSGVVAPSRTPDALAASLLDIFRNHQEWKEYSKKAGSIAQSFSLEVMVEQTTQFYRQLLNDKKLP